MGVGFGAFSPIRCVVSHRLQSADSGTSHPSLRNGDVRWARMPDHCNPTCGLLQFVTPKKGSSLLGQRGVKVGGFRVPMQDVSGVTGSARNEAMTVWVHGD